MTRTIDIEIMSEILDEMVRSAVLVKERTVDANHVLIAMTARLVTLMRRSFVKEAGEE